MATYTTDIPFSRTTTKIRTGSDNLEAEAIGLEVPVRIVGTQVTAVVMETTEHAEPFQEDTSTMIVFPRGAVIKLLARVRTGQTIELTNRHSNQKTSCRVIQVNSANNVVHYVKLEFVQLSPGFWGVHFPSDPSSSMRQPESVAPVAPLYPASPSPAPASTAPDILRHTAIPDRVPSAPLAEIPAPAVSSATLAAPPAPPQTEQEIAEMTFPSSLAPTAPPSELNTPPASKETAPIKKRIGYGLPRNWQKEQFEPLAAGPASAASVESAVAALEEVPPPAAGRIPVPGRRPQPSPPSPRRAERAEKPVRPVYGELHSFGSVSSEATSAVLPDATLNISSASNASSASARSRSKLLPALAAVSVLAVVASGAMYVRRNPGLFAGSNAAQTVSSDQSATQAVAPQSVSPSEPATSAPPAAALPPASVSSGSSSPAPSTSPTIAAKNATPAPKKPVASAFSSKSTRTAVEAGAASIAPAASATKSEETAGVNFYAGDLNARPERKVHAAKRMDAQVPQIASSVPGSVPDSSSLSSLVPGTTSNLATPAPSASVVRQGGILEQPKLVSSVPPVYPSLARQNGVEGDVTIQAEIDISGYVNSMKVLSGPLLLRNAAMNALRKWHYAPAKLDGKPISMQYNVTIRFHLNN